MTQSLTRVVIDGFCPRRSLGHVTLRYVTVKDLCDGLLVEYFGEEADARGVLSDDLTLRAVALYPGHPGRIWCPLVQHVQVSWVGLEEEPASYAVGFSPDNLAADGRFLGLGHLAEAEFIRREAAIRDILARGRELSGWVPPWRAGGLHSKQAP